MIKALALDIQADCIHSAHKPNTISKAFGFRPNTAFRHIPSLESNGKELILREKRQLIALATIAAISFISIFSTSQLMSMANWGDDDLVTNQNHIITAIQDQDNRLNRNEDNIKRLANHVEQLEKHLYIMNQVQEALITALSIKNQAVEIVNHIQDIEIGLYNLLKRNLTPYLVSTDVIQGTLKLLGDKVAERGYSLATYQATEAIQLETSFVSYNNGEVIALLHLPIYKIQTALFAYKYEALPITTQKNQTTLFIEASKPILAISLKNDLHVEMTEFELEHKCKFFKSSYYCHENSILQKSVDSGCLTALYKRQKINIAKLCSVQLFSKDEYVIQINSTTFLAYSKRKTNAYISCSEKGESIFEDNYIINAATFNYITLHANCVFNIGNHLMTSNLPVHTDVFARITGVNINLTNLVEFKEEEMVEFTKFVKRDVLSTQHNVRINDVKRKYELRKLSHKSSILEKIWKMLVTVVAIILAILVITIVIKLIYKFCDLGKRNNPRPPMRNYQLSEIRSRINIPSDDTQIEDIDSWDQTTETVTTLRG